MWFITHCLFMALLSQIVKSTFRNIGVTGEDFYIPGDINIAFINSFYHHSSVTKKCYKPELATFQSAEALQFRLRQVNQDESILPNISLGMFFLKECGDVQTAIFQATKLLPTKGLKNCCSNKNKNATATKDSYSVSAALISPPKSYEYPSQVGEYLGHFRFPQ